MFGQKTEWFTCPARLNDRFFWYRFTRPSAFFSRASASCSSAVFAPAT